MLYTRTTNRNQLASVILARRNLCDQELCQGLPVSIFPLVMLFGLHLVHNHLLPLELFQDLCLDSDIFQVRSAT